MNNVLRFIIPPSVSVTGSGNYSNDREKHFRHWRIRDSEKYNPYKPFLSLTKNLVAKAYGKNKEPRVCSHRVVRIINPWNP
jgi:hypothetical protein